MRREKQILEVGITSKEKVTIFKEKNNTYYFESTNPDLTYFFTNDFMEAVSALMKLKDLANWNELWDLQITEEMKNSVNYNKSLYWLTGGDKEWIKSKIYRKSWGEVSHIYLDNYKNILDKALKKVETLGDMREFLIKNLNLPTLYEFSLNYDIIK